MLHFSGGPADGVDLLGQRAPLLLRVVYCTSGDAFDVLDQLSDAPATDEVVYVYERVGEPARGMLDYSDRGGRRRGMRFISAEYRFLEHQPGDSHTRDNQAWQAWCGQRVRPAASGTEPIAGRSPS
jgi:hypothetical protein